MLALGLGLVTFSNTLHEKSLCNFLVDYGWTRTVFVCLRACVCVCVFTMDSEARRGFWLTFEIITLRQEVMREIVVAACRFIAESIL
jgi:hypothetical protein